MDWDNIIKIRIFPLSLSDADDAGAAAATSAAASAACIYYVIIEGCQAPPYKYMIKCIQQQNKKPQQLQQQQHLDKTQGEYFSF